MAKYAAETTVASDRSRAEIERTLQRYGARAFAYGWDDDGMTAVVMFKIANRQIRFQIRMPDPNSREFTRTPGKGLLRSQEAAEAAWEQAGRQRWRALALVIKAKLEAVDAGITTVEQEFGMAILLPDGRTVAEVVLPQIAESYATGRMPAMLPAGGAS